ncbi:hypothetical protein BJY21_003967 [Kineosphaera limosa]|uniref:Uncharacterized protein n=1 Tax=Kineosphaera limosa NBRC 100340 TaxID=1184609 RepID=K6W4X5_9MICO|nr:hypothetical protein [Kineosphaera limosa]NYE02783.1 hypothetical protein [Kineosphaera limosa]GAB94215.1 hypothetical protein KILIM_004_00040 [Kineosphaera limosa NBRC 100340]
MRTFLIAFRRSAGMYAFPGALLVHLLNLGQVGTQVSYEWRIAAASVSTAMVITMPLAAATAAADSLRYRRVGAQDLVLTPGSRLAFHTLRTLAVWAWFVLAHTVALAAHWVLAMRAHGSFGLFDPWIAYSSTLVLLAAAALGTLVGWLVPRFVTPPLLAVVLYVVPAYGGLLTSRHALMYSGAVEFPGEHVNRFLQSGQVVWFLAVTATCLLALSAQAAWGKAATAVCAVALLAGYVWVGIGAQQRYLVADASPPPMVCVGTAPTVCTFAESPRAAYDVAPMIVAVNAAVVSTVPDARPAARIVPCRRQDRPPTPSWP